MCKNLIFRRISLLVCIIGAVTLFGCDGNREVLQVIYTGNLAGYLEPCGCPEGWMGGLSRFRSAASAMQRRWKGEVLLLDAGEFAEPYGVRGYPKNRAILEAFSTLGYHAVNVCARDLIAGVETLRWTADTLKLPLISANLVVAETGEKLFPGWVINDVGNKSVAVIGLGMLRSFDLNRAGVEYVTYTDPEEALRKSLAQ